MKRIFYLRLLLILLILPMLMLASSCTAVADVNVKAWIDTPVEGYTYPPNEPINIATHAFAKAGVAEVILYINGEAFQRVVVNSPENELVSQSQTWTPAEPGTYVLQIYAIDINGERSLPASVVINVAIPSTPTFTLTPTVPTSTATPTATATFTATPTATCTATIYVPPPATYTPTIKFELVDLFGPPAPSPAVPANGVNLSCRSTQTLAWIPVSDPSGIQGYYVSVEKVSGGGDWVNEGSYGPISGKQVDISVDCGIKYRWKVMAKDGAGNSGDWSSKVEFTILLD